MPPRYTSVIFFSTILLLSVIFIQCIPSHEETTIYMVRHAEKVLDDTADPDLTPVGLQRAQKLADMLKTKEINFIFSSDFIRTRKTAQPLAEMLEMDIRNYNHKDFEPLIEFIEKNKGTNILVVGHSHSTPLLVNTLLGEEKYEAIDESNYTHIYTVRIHHDGKITAELSFY